MNSITKATCSLLLMLPLAACAKPEEPAKTQTNEQGCTRIRSVGPQDPYRNPPPLKQACLGPHLLEIPQNYFYNQLGTEHDGSYALVLEYPLLKPYMPGERTRWNADVEARKVTFDYQYVDRIDIREAMRRKYIPMDYKKDDPQEHLENRIAGEKFHDLNPYYLDMDIVRSYYRKKGFKEDAPVMSPNWHDDWFLHQSDDGEVSTVIKCTPREIKVSGVEYVDGKMVRSRGKGFSDCQHFHMISELKVLVQIRYPRDSLKDWRRMELRAQELISQFKVER